MSDSTRLKINEIYRSIQGESTWAGAPCVFVRLTGCHLRCTYCDSAHAFFAGQWMTIGQIVAQVGALAKRALPADEEPSVERGGACDPECSGSDTGAAVKGGNPPVTRGLVEITGGEPLLQPGCGPLAGRLLAEGYTVLCETAGALPIDRLPPGVIRIMDLKCPSSAESQANEWSNIGMLTGDDEVKFVIGDRGDYEWSADVVRRYELADRCKAVLFSPVFGRIEPVRIVEWILQDDLPVRFQLQLHKYIWEPTRIGV